MTYGTKDSGQIMVQVIIFGTLAIMLISGFAQWGALQLKASRNFLYREQALAVAEAGIEYYRWHLAHAPQDYQDGTGRPGPYAHEYYDKNDNNIGRFILTITPPPLGSTLVKISSEGKVYADSSVSRKVAVEMGIPSWTKYAVAANDFMRFGSGAEVWGEIYSNEGIRFDGLAHNLVTSVEEAYNDPDHTGSNEFGVHTHKNPVDPLPPDPVPSRPDVFMAGRRFPAAELDFAGLAANLSQLKTKAQTGGLYVASSGAQGYNVVLKTDDTFDLYRIDSLVASPPGCRITSQGSQWGTWSINGQTLIATYAFPQNGVMFVEDHLWIEGQINTARLTIASGRFPENPSTNTSITVNKNVLYTDYGGSDAIGLIAQENFNVGLRSNDNLQIDAALIAKNGRAGRFYYRLSCGPEYVRNSLTLRGSIATNKRYGFAYTDGTGYQTRNLIYDANLLYAPPPDFPLTTDQYATLLWKETR